MRPRVLGSKQRLFLKSIFNNHMVWYKKQLAQKLKEIDGKKSKIQKKDPKKTPGHAFDPSKLKGSKSPFKNPVAEMNRNRKKTDIF